MLLVTPAIVYLVARKLVPVLPSLLITAAVLITRSYPDKVNNLAESVAYPLALAGLLSGLHSLALTDRDSQARYWLFTTALLLSVAVLLRPNLLPAAGLYLVFCLGGATCLADSGSLHWHSGLVSLPACCCSRTIAILVVSGSC